MVNVRGEARVITIVCLALALLSGLNESLTRAFSGELFLNLSQSMPRGFYLATSREIGRGEIVVVHMPVKALYEPWLHSKGLLVKRVVAVKGDTVCWGRGYLRVNGRPKARVKRKDFSRRRLPRVRGCRVLTESELLLLGYGRKSFDSRYFGPVLRETIKVTVKPLWIKL